jgi:hypothetical protein
MPIESKEYIPIVTCQDSQLKQLRKAGFETDGYIRSMEEILTTKGFGLPSQADDRSFGFRYGKYVRGFLTYPDALAGQIMFLHEEGVL